MSIGERLERDVDLAMGGDWVSLGGAMGSDLTAPLWGMGARASGGGVPARAGSAGTRGSDASLPCPLPPPMGSGGGAEPKCAFESPGAVRGTGMLGGRLAGGG